MAWADLTPTEQEQVKQFTRDYRAPFTNAAGGDFGLTTAAKAALRSLGFPASYLGAATDPHITIGAVQYGAAEAGGGGAVSISPFRGNF